MDIPIIRDMTSRCKCCGNYHFAENINKDGLCHNCANGNAPKAKDDDNTYDWDDF